MPAIYYAMRGRPPAYTKTQIATALTGVDSILAYSIVIWGMQDDAIGVISALRETSVVYEAIIGRFFLKEKLTARRIISCPETVMAAACLAY